MLDQAIRDVSPRKSNSSSGKLSKRSWLRRKPKIVQLTSQLSALAASLNAALNILQGVQSSITANQTAIKLDLVLEQVESFTTKWPNTTRIVPPDNGNKSIIGDEKVEELGVTSKDPEPHVASRSISRQASCESFHSAFSSSSDSSGTLISFSGSLSADTECENFCPCQCHVSTQSKMPWWMTQLLGCMTTHGNGSILLNRRVCNKKHCRRSGSARLQISYVAPAWALLPAFNIYVRAETIAGLIPTFNMFMPRIIPKSAAVWSVIELGRLDDLRRMLSKRETTPYDISAQGMSLVKVRNFSQFHSFSNLRHQYATLKGQNEILACLLTEKSDPFYRDRSGM